MHGYKLIDGLCLDAYGKNIIVKNFFFLSQFTLHILVFHSYKGFTPALTPHLIPLAKVI